MFRKVKFQNFFNHGEDMTTTENNKIRSFCVGKPNFKIFFNHGEGMTRTKNSKIRPLWAYSACRPPSWCLLSLIFRAITTFFGEKNSTSPPPWARAPMTWWPSFTKKGSRGRIFPSKKTTEFQKNSNPCRKCGCLSGDKLARNRVFCHFLEFKSLDFDYFICFLVCLLACLLSCFLSFFLSWHPVSLPRLGCTGVYRGVPGWNLSNHPHPNFEKTLPHQWLTGVLEWPTRVNASEIWIVKFTPQWQFLIPVNWGAPGGNFAFRGTPR